MFGSVMRRMQALDTYTKARADYVQSKTSLGAIISISAGIIMFALFVSEFLLYREIHVQDHVRVDTRQGSRDLTITLDMTLTALNCDDVDIGAEDSKGVPYDFARNHVVKFPTTSSEPTEGEQQKGCRLTGTLELKKVAGTFYITMAHHILTKHIAGQHSHLLSYEQLKHFNASHHIHLLAFGPKFPGQTRPLDDTNNYSTQEGAQFQYFVQLVPTIWRGIDGVTVDSEQFSATEFVRHIDSQSGSLVQPGIYFRYDVSPILVEISETRKSLFTFFTSVCAIVGGIFTVAGLINKAAHMWLDNMNKRA